MLTNKEIYQRHAAAIERFFINKVSSDQDIEDLLQQTFERLFRQRALGREVRDCRPFLIGIAKNVLFEYWRQRNRLDKQDDIGECSLFDLGSGISTLMKKSEEQQLVLEALRTIKIKYQMVLELFYWERLSYQRIAEILGVCEGTVGTWLRRGRDQLRRSLEGVA